MSVIKDLVNRQHILWSNPLHQDLLKPKGIFGDEYPTVEKQRKIFPKSRKQNYVIQRYADI